MSRWTITGLLLGLGATVLVGGDRAIALPGQTAEAAAEWIRAHPVLNPAPGERFLIRKSDTPARRLVFQASTFPVGPGPVEISMGRIRSEEIAIVDLVKGVTPQRLTESLRTIYGVNIYQDYTSAPIVYRYPRGQARNGLQGEVRLGQLYGYWIETVQGNGKRPHSGRITVFVRTDLPRLQTALTSQYGPMPSEAP